MGATPGAGDRGPVGVALLGSTGSIGTQAVDVIEAAGPDAFRIVALAAGRDGATLARQAQTLRPRSSRWRTPTPGPTCARGTLGGATLIDAPDAMVRMAVRDDVDLVIVATGGVVSLRPVLAALEAGKVVATANKETLVAGGHLVMPLARARAAEVAARDRSSPLASPLAWLRPIDSEHSAHLAVPRRRGCVHGAAPHPDRLGRAVPRLAGATVSRPRPPAMRSRIRPGTWARRSRSTRPRS